MRLRATLATAAAVLIGAVAAAVTFASPASAASLTQITSFGTNPTNLGMYLYVPNTVTAHPAILVAVHYCTGSGPAFYSGTEFASLADRYGFVVIYPSATRSGNCFDVSTAGALTHNGNSDPVGIVSMVQYVEQHNNGDASRVYVTGASSGGMMTNVLIGDYPDVFKAGAAFMGVPFACFAATAGDPTNPANPAGWNSACANGQVSQTPAAWGDLVRGAYPGYTGARPRMQLWHGTADTALYYANFGEEIKQWTNVLAVSQTPSTTDTPVSGWTHTAYQDSSGVAQVDAYSIAGAGHVLPQTGMAAYAIHFFGLDGTSTSSPSPTTASPSPTTASPSPTTGGGSGACKVSDSVSSWNTGMTENLTITNTGGAAISGWKLTFTLASGETITSGWNATYSPTTGAVTATNVSYNGGIPAGGSTSVGFQGTHTAASSSAPTSFSLNGAACTVS
jgi:poly(hydroxyalkanoate) depolymerase family esterase